jgi:hypothetical protein
MTATTTALGELIARLKHGETVSLPDREGWAAMIARTTLFSRVCKVAGETYDYFLEVSSAVAACPARTRSSAAASASRRREGESSVMLHLAASVPARTLPPDRPPRQAEKPPAPRDRGRLGLIMRAIVSLFCPAGDAQEAKRLLVAHALEILAE